jgi:hypothetical protein
MAFTGNYVCNTFKSGLLAGTFDFVAPTADVYKIALYTANATLNADTQQYTTTDEVVASGYTAGGVVITPSVGFLDGIAFLDFSDAIWSGAFTARGALIYKVGGPAMYVLDFGADRTSATQFKVEFPPPTSSSALVRIS